MTTTTRAAADGRRTSTGTFPVRIDDRRFALLLIAPAALFLLVFIGWPLVQFVTSSFFEIDQLAGTREFVGLRNYVSAFSDPAFGNSAWRTAVYTAVVVVCEFVLGLLVALLFVTLGDRSRVFRTIFLYPLMIAPIVAGLLWKFLLSDNFGIVGQLLHDAGLLATPNSIRWLSDPDIALISVSLPDIWLTTSFITLVLFAGLQNIPGDVLEAARLDGARYPTLLFRIVIPLLRPVIAVALIVRGVDAARAFDVIVLQTNGGPQNATETMSLLVYQTQIRYGDPGLASAMGTIYLIVMLAVAIFAIFKIWRPGSER